MLWSLFIIYSKTALSIYWEQNISKIMFRIKLNEIKSKFVEPFLNLFNFILVAIFANQLTFQSLNLGQKFIFTNERRPRVKSELLKQNQES